MSYAAVPRTPEPPLTPASMVRADRGSLSKRQLEVVRRILAGQEREHIASELHISVHTVHHHVYMAQTKIGAASVPQMAFMLGRLGVEAWQPAREFESSNRSQS